MKYATPSGNSFLSDYVKFNEGNECPTSYHIWSALCLLSAVVSRKVYLDFETQWVYPNLYVCLVGKQGLRKSTAKDIARDILETEFPNIPRAAAITTKEAITKYMATDDCLRAYEESVGSNVEYRPLTLFINELKNFLSVNPQGMLDFLTDIYDRKFFDTNYKNSPGETIVNPYLVMLACETPKWIRDKMKADVISGGFARRLIPVYEKSKRCSIPRPFMTKDMWQARESVVKRLHDIKNIKGKMVWELDAVAFYDDWYNKLKEPEDPMMEGYYSSKHTQLQKVGLLLTIADYGDLKLRKGTLEMALAILDGIEENMKKLYEGAGLNVLAEPTKHLLSLMRLNGGYILEKEFYRQAYKDMDRRQAEWVIRHLTQVDEVVKYQRESKGTKKMYLVLKEFEEDFKSGKKTT